VLDLEMRVQQADENLFAADASTRQASHSVYN
jgi:hypothetical protein